jgi:hypothetical protein
MIFTDWVKTVGTASSARVTDRISGSYKSVQDHGSRFRLPPSAKGARPEFVTLRNWRAAVSYPNS